MVTMADILEEIVGEFTTTPSHDTRHVHHEPDGTLLIDGRIAVHSLNRRLDWNLPTDDARTLSGLLVHHNEALPEAGAAFEIEGFRMRVERLGDRKSVVEGTSVSVGVDLGGGRIIKKKRRREADHYNMN